MSRKKKIKLTYKIKKKGFLGITHTVTKENMVEVDSSLYKRLKKQEQSKRHKPFSVEEMMLYDDIFD